VNARRGARGQTRRRRRAAGREEQPRSGEWRSATTPGKERLGSRVGNGTGTEGAVTRRWKASRVVESSSPSRAVGVKRSSAPPKVGAQAMAGAHERGDGDRGVRGMVVRFASGEENAPACTNRAIRRSGQGAVKHQALRTRAGASSLRVGSRRSTGARCQCDGKQSLVGRIERRSQRGAARQSEAGGASWKEAASR